MIRSDPPMAWYRPGPVRWFWYALGGRLPARYRPWVLHDLTCRTWPLRLWVPETARTARDLPVRRDRWPGMIRWWRCG